MALLCGVDEELDAMPVLNDGILRECGAENFVPADHLLVVSGKNLLDARAEVRLQLFSGFEAMGVHEDFDLGVGAPVFAVTLITTDVHVGIGEETGHFAEKAVDELECGFARGIECCVVDAEFVRDCIRAGRAAEIRITDEPALNVTGHIELGDDADAARGCVGDDFADLLLCVVLTVGAEFSELGVNAAFNAEALVLGEVPVKDVELDGGHSVESAQNVGDRKEVAAGIEHESAPGEAGCVFNVDGWKDVGGTEGLKELKERLHSVEGADVGFGMEGDVMFIDVEGVAFIDVQLGNSLRGDGGNVDGEGGLAGLRRWRFCERDTSACFEAADEAHGGIAEAWAGIAVKGVGERRIDVERAELAFKRGGQGHEVVDEVGRGRQGWLRGD